MGEFWDSVTGWAREHLTDWTIVKMYIACAVAGGTVLLGQLGLNLFGIGDADADLGDVDAELEGDAALNVLSVRAISGFLCAFGLMGWKGSASGWNPTVTLFSAFGAGLAIMLLVAVIMRMFVRMNAEGNLDPKGAIGRTAQVYLKIPAEMSGKGKITVSIQGRTMEFDAVTAGAELPTGSACRLVDMTTEDTFEVAPLA